MERVFRCLLTFLLCLVAAMECLQVLLRYILEMPIMWLYESIIFLAVWLYMLGCANASRENTQIVAKILPVFFSGPRQTAFFDLCAQCFSAVISCWLTWYAVEYFFYTFEADRKTGYLFLPMTIGETALCAGMLLVTWYTLLQLARSARRMRALLQKGKPLCS